MLNENLSKIRKERGLTQEALAAKLHIVRQTVSKWENGTAVPDADMLCHIADALEVPVVDLLGKPGSKDELNDASIARILAEINEQLAIQNRNSSRSLKDVSWDIVMMVVGLLGNAILLLLGTVYFSDECYEVYVDDVLVSHHDGFIAFLINYKLWWLLGLFMASAIAGFVWFLIKKKKSKESC